MFAYVSRRRRKPTISLLIRRLLCEFLGREFAQRADDPSLLICSRCRLLRVLHLAQQPDPRRPRIAIAIDGEGQKGNECGGFFGSIGQGAVWPLYGVAVRGREGRGSRGLAFLML